MVLSCPESPGFEAQLHGEVAEHLREVGVRLILEGQLKTTEEALTPTLTFIFLSSTWAFYSCDCVVFQYIKPSAILWPCCIPRARGSSPAAIPTALTAAMPCSEPAHQRDFKKCSEDNKATIALAIPVVHAVA